MSTKRLTTEIFINRSDIIHNNLYIYDLVKYINNRTKVPIICPIHGIFWQLPKAHLRGSNGKGHGCPKCFRKATDIIYLKQSLTNEEDPIEIDGIVQCKCSYCKEYFMPSQQQLRSRIRSLYGKHRGENRLYCSDQCKEDCSLFHQKKYPKGNKPYIDTSRPDQPELRQLTLTRDNFTCQRCGSTEDLVCHHFTGVEVNPTESADVDNCITLCKECHDRLHSSGQCDTRRQPCVMV